MLGGQRGFSLPSGTVSVDRALRTITFPYGKTKSDAKAFLLTLGDIEISDELTGCCGFELGLQIYCTKLQGTQVTFEF